MMKTMSAVREENNALTMEITNIRSMLILAEEQIVVLKDSFRDVQSELTNEKEFNAEHRRVNAEYLVNILKKFLLSTNLSEREKLVTVLCSILHISVDETTIIIQKWTVEEQEKIVSNSTGGVVVGNGAMLRWLLQPETK